MSPLRCCYPLLACLLALSCTSHTHQKTVIPAYYFWRTGTYIEDDEKKLLRKHNIHILYTKILDIDWDGINGAVPVASLDIHDFNRQLNLYDSLAMAIVPVVFITNKTFVNIDSSDITLLAVRILRRCLPAYDSTDIAYEARNHMNDRAPARPREIQFDCDWTAATARKYFYFLQTVRQYLPSDSIQLSATIRLHQYKYQHKTGVPPVNRGMLMLYNVSDLTQYSPVNSIFERDKAAAYFTGHEAYPLPLDIALPAYSWGLVFRNKKFYQVENGLDAGTLQGSNVFAAEGNPGATGTNTSNGVNFYRVEKDTVFGELFLRPGDEIKIESIDSAQLAAAAGLARQALNTDTLRLALFELSSIEIKNFTDETLAHIYSSYR